MVVRWGMRGPTLTSPPAPSRPACPALVGSMTYTMEREATAPDLAWCCARPADRCPTSDYMVIEAVALDGARSWVHLGYAYRISNHLAQWAMSASGHGRAQQDRFHRNRQGRSRTTPVRAGRARFAGTQCHAQLPGPGGVCHALLARGDITRADRAASARLVCTDRGHSAQPHELSLDEYLAEKHRDLAQTPMQ